MPKYPHTSDVGRAYHRAQRSETGYAARPTVGSVEIDYAGECLEPVYIFETGRPYVDKRDGSHAIVSTKIVRCRKCEPCRYRHAREWRARASKESQIAVSQFLCTLTFSEAERYAILAEINQYLRRNGMEWSALSDDNRARYLERFAFRRVQKWLKRIRHQTVAHLRFLCVAEATEERIDKMVHFHLLVHSDLPITTDMLNYVAGCRYRPDGTYNSRTWRHGFMSVKSVRNEHAVNYATKILRYVTKCIGSRVRASQHYGESLRVGSAQARERNRSRLKREDATSGP